MCGIGVGKKVFVVVSLGSDVFVARVDLYVNVVGSIPGGCSSGVYFLNNRLWLKVGIRMGEDHQEKC